MPVNFPDHRLTGEALLSAIDTPESDPTPLIDGMLYDSGAFMIAADPEAGKSTIALQMAICLSSGAPLFGSLAVPSPKRVYYIQLERPPKEVRGRMRLMRERLTINATNFMHDPIEGFNALNTDHVSYLIRRIAEWGKPDVIFLDPIYAAVSGGLGKDESATAFCRFSSLLMGTFNCVNVLLHHTHRPKYHEGQEVEEADPFYGSIWLKAHVTASYHLKVASSDKSSVCLTSKKDSYRITRQQIILHYDPVTHTNYFKDSDSTLPAIDKLLAYISQCRLTGKPTSLYSAKAATGISEAHLRRLMKDPAFKAVVRLVPHANPANPHDWIIL